MPSSVREGDRLLQLLTRMRCVLVVQLAHAASVLAAHEAWHLCCFRTPSDFARERLRRDGRWLRDMIRLHEALERQPSLLCALSGDDGGRPLGQVAALQVARVATQDSIDTWIERARALPLDELRAAVRRHLHESVGGGAGEDAAPRQPVTDLAVDRARGPDSATCDDEEAPRFTLRHDVPPDVKWAFDAAHDLHRSVEGGEASLTRFVQALVGEAASSGCLPPDDFTARLPDPHTSHSRAPHSRGRWNTARSSARHGAGREVWHDAVPEALHDAGREARHEARDRSPTPHDGAAAVLALQTPAVHRAVRRLATFEKLRSGLERLDHKLRSVSSRGTKPIGPTHRRDVKRIARILERLLRIEDGLEIDIGDLLLELHEHEAWNMLGFSGIESYAESRLGVAGSTARRRVALARSLRPLPLVRQAYESGIIGFVATEWIARARRTGRADAETQRQFIAHARTVTVKRLGQEERQREGERLLARIATASAMMPVPAGRSGHPVTPTAIKPHLPNMQADSVILPDSATAKRSPLAPTASNQAPCSPRALDSLPMNDAAWHASLRRVPGETRSKVIDLGYGLLERLVRGGPLTHVPLMLRLPATDAADLLGCIEAARRGLGGVSTTPAEDTQLAPSARMARDFHDRGLRVPEWVGLLALLEEWVWVHDDPRSMPLRPDRHILERDGYRCMAPGCLSRRRLHVHHLHYRSDSGSDDDWNLLVLCSYHHLQGEHGGLARIRGRAPLDIDWRLGCPEFSLHYRNERRTDIGSAA